MYAIVEIAGQQIKVAKDQKVYVNRLPVEEGENISFDRVLLISNGNDISVGAPAIDGALVGAKVVKHLKGDKVIVFKKKRRKGYRTKTGHRQYLSQIVIESIETSGAKKQEAKPKAEAPKSSPKVEKSTKESKPSTADTKAKKEVEVSETLVTRAQNRADAANIDINLSKLLTSIGTALKADANDLQAINGIGPVYEEKLNDLGICTYEQISRLKAADREALSAIDGITRDKIEEEEWVKQAKELLKNK